MNWEKNQNAIIVKRILEVNSSTRWYNKVVFDNNTDLDVRREKIDPFIKRRVIQRKRKNEETENVKIVAIRICEILNDCMIILQKNGFPKYFFIFSQETLNCLKNKYPSFEVIDARENISTDLKIC